MNSFDDDHDNHDNRDISERLHRLARGAQIGSVEPEEDVRRGRARLRRRQALSVVGSSAAVIVVALGVAALVNSGGRTLTPADAGATPSVVASDASPTVVASSSSACPTTLTLKSALTEVGTDPLSDPRIKSALTSYAQILAAHLDPRGRHLQKVPTGFTGTSPLGCGPAAQSEIGTKLSWTTPGKPGEAMVAVSVTNDWADDQIHLAFDHWEPALPPDQVTAAWKATDSAGHVAVAIQRADGTTVAIETDQVFGNNSTSGVAGFGFTTTQLLYAAADPGLVLPSAQS